MNNESSKNNTEQAVYKKQIGNIVYTVTPYFSKTSKETIDDKIIRLIKQEIETNR